MPFPKQPVRGEFLALNEAGGAVPVHWKIRLLDPGTELRSLSGADLETADGRSVTRLAKGDYRVDGGERLHSMDPHAP